MKKVTKKINTKCDIVVNVDGMTCSDDVYYAIALAKLEKYFTYNEVKVLVDNLKPKFTVYCCDGNCPFCHTEKKPNIFKRFWNWITSKK